MTSGAGLATVLALLLATGWAANHFSALIPVYGVREDLSTALLDGAFGLYALGLLPGLFGGGALSDRFGRPAVVLPGATIAALGTVLLMVDHVELGVLLGRLVVGQGAGLTFGAGTAWAADLGATRGTVLAGVFLTSGFGIGPVVSGVLAESAPAPLTTPYVLSLVVSLVAVAAAVLVAVPATPRTDPSTRPAPLPHHDARTALAWSGPVGILVFASATTTLVPLPARLPEEYDGPVLVGVAAALTLFTGIAVQALARRVAGGARTGVLGAGCAALGWVLAAAGGSTIGLPLFVGCCLLLGSAYGLCLREGLLDVETLAPPAKRGTLTGVFYVLTYLGFGLPLLLTAVQPTTGDVAPFVVLAAIAAAVAVLRVGQLRRGHPGRLA
ncbi:permease [Marmoricola endophyticus]|uniref:Permease n=1 Tax=Marmoricola endophyticus TaxID=2040280 RepID=A0A917BCK5_9ACTN|nr:MFS transporter [Marmoricola endophyticus]GGF31960.1 permease [Marmoricola endophyticus]